MLFEMHMLLSVSYFDIANSADKYTLIDLITFSICQLNQDSLFVTYKIMLRQTCNKGLA